MFILMGASAKLKFIKKILDRDGVHVEETKYPDFILTVRDPTPYIPSEYLNSIKIKALDENEPYFNILKNSGLLKELEVPKEFDVDTPVRVIGGEYAELTGIIARNEPRHCVVVVNVFGKPVKVEVNHSDLQVISAP